jgi:tetratricopeptide (TPR) repeat protein
MDRLRGDLLYDRLGMAAPPSIFTRTWLAFSLADIGAFDDALARAQEALRIGEETDHPYGLYHGFFGLGAVHAQRGDLDRAIGLLERGLAMASLTNMPAMAMPSSYYLGHAYGLAGRTADAISLLEGNLQQAERMAWKSFHTLGVVHLGSAYLLAGRREEAVRIARRAHDLASECQQRGDEVRARLLLAQIAAADDPPAIEDADAHFRAAVAQAEQLGMRPLAAHSYLGLGKLYRCTGDRTRAQEHLQTAATMYREMGMGYWLEQAEAEIRGPA